MTGLPRSTVGLQVTSSAYQLGLVPYNAVQQLRDCSPAFSLALLSKIGSEGSPTLARLGHAKNTTINDSRAAADRHVGLDPNRGQRPPHQ